jgi:hypothetical protein
MLTVRAAQMSAHRDADLSLAGSYRRAILAERARELRFSLDPQALQAIKDRMHEYHARLLVAKTSDLTVAGEGASADLSRALRWLHLLLLPLALVGVGLHALPYRLPRWVATRAKGAPDVLSTYKVGVGLIAYPLSMLLLFTIALFQVPTRIAGAFGWALLLAIACAIPASAFAALAWMDHREQRRGLGMLPDASVLAALRAERMHLMQLLDAAYARSQSEAGPPPL